MSTNNPRQLKPLAGLIHDIFYMSAVKSVLFCLQFEKALNVNLDRNGTSCFAFIRAIAKIELYVEISHFPDLTLSMELHNECI